MTGLYHQLILEERGMAASGYARWFERLLAELQFELWMGDATEIQRKRGRKQKTDRQDAAAHFGFVAGERLSGDLGAELGDRHLRQLL
jgi:transposase